MGQPLTKPMRCPTHICKQVARANLHRQPDPAGHHGLWSQSVQEEAARSRRYLLLLSQEGAGPRLQTRGLAPPYCRMCDIGRCSVVSLFMLVRSSLYACSSTMQPSDSPDWSDCDASAPHTKHPVPLVLKAGKVCAPESRQENTP